MDSQIDIQKLVRFGNLELLAKQAVEGFITGLHKSPFHGFSVEFAEHRLYNKGESTRHIDWKLYARTEKLFTKRYKEETNLRCQILIDTSSSMYFPDEKEKMNKLQFAVFAAASLIELLRKQRDAVGLSLFDDDVNLHTPAKSSSAHHRFLFSELEKKLAGYEPKEKSGSSVVNALHQIAENIHKRSMVIILSDMMDSEKSADELFSALQHLKHNKHEVILFNMNDGQKEMDFQFENRPYTFIDMETGDQVKLHPSEVRDQYFNSMQTFAQEVKLKCGQYRVDYVDADINQGVNHVLIQHMIKRNKML